MLDLLKPPVFEDEAKTHQAYVLHIIVWALIVVPAPYVLVTALSQPENLGRALGQAAFGEAVNIFLLYLLRRGQVRAASLIQVTAFWLFFSVTAWTGSGVVGPAYLLGSGLVIAIASILLSGRGALVVTLLTIGFGGVMAQAEARGALRPAFQDDAQTTWLISAFLLPVGAVLQYLAARAIRLALVRARASEARFRTLVEAAPIGILILNARAVIEAVNPAGCALLGYGQAELLGRALADLIAPDQHAEFQSSFANAGAATPREMTLRRGAGQPLTALATLSRIPDGRFQFIFQDITERKRVAEALEQEHRLLRTVIDNLPDYIYLKDTQHRCLVSNLANARALGASSPEEVVGKTLHDFYPAEEAERYSALDNAVVASGQAVNTENSFIDLATGQRRWTWMTRIPFRAGDGTLIGVVGISRDITVRRQAEEAVRQLNLALEKRVDERTVQLQNANQDLEAFAYSVSHDLRAPLRAIEGFSRVALEDCGASASDELRHYLQRIRAAAQRMSGLIDDLLAFSRLGRQSLKIRPLSPEEVREMVSTVFRELAAHSAAGRPPELALGELPACRADPALLRQILENLLSNALKYTREREQPRIEIGADERTSEIVYFVRDNGAGFDMRYADKLFGVFQRLHHAEEFEGTGIGLANVKRIVERHGGRVWAEAEVGKGATFYFALPRPAEAEEIR